MRSQLAVVVLRVRPGHAFACLSSTEAQATRVPPRVRDLTAEELPRGHVGNDPFYPNERVRVDLVDNVPVKEELGGKCGFTLGKYFKPTLALTLEMALLLRIQRVGLEFCGGTRTDQS